MTDRVLRILGTRGIPAKHGGFETLADYLARYLAAQGWQVTVYCQEEGSGEIHESYLQNIRLVHVPVDVGGALGTMLYDWKSIVHASGEPGVALTLGYNTAIFCAWLRLHGVKNVINMDGVEWRRQKWGWAAKAWLFCNERFAAWLGNHLIADHPSIKQHLMSHSDGEKITMIAYGAPRIVDADAGVLERYALTPNSYAIVVCRPEPENSTLEIVRAWSAKKRGMKLVVLGNYSREVAYQRAVLDAASEEVFFPGSIYDHATLGALRFYARICIHGHQVGGTNPSLVEALGAGNPILARHNEFNRWVVGEHAAFFESEADLTMMLDELLNDDVRLTKMRHASIRRHTEAFSWNSILTQYEDLLSSFLPSTIGIESASPTSSRSD